MAKLDDDDEQTLGELDRQYFGTLSKSHRVQHKTAPSYSSPGELEDLRQDLRENLIDRHFMQQSEDRESIMKQPPMKLSEDAQKEKQRPLDKLTVGMAARKLLPCVLHLEPELLVLNKPAGIAVHGGGSAQSENKPHGYTLEELMPKLLHHIRANKKPELQTWREMLLPSSRSDEAKLEPLIPHRLDKFASGVLLVALTRERNRLLTEAFAKRLVLKEYHCLTARVPRSDDGLIAAQIFSSQEQQSSRFKQQISRKVSRTSECIRTGILPNNITLDRIAQLLQASSMDHQHSTYFHVLDRFQGTALVSCWALTGARHQVRVHLGQGLRCPILGDHKFSHMSHMAPQVLNWKTLESLAIRQSKVRNLSMNLHATKLIYPATASKYPVNGLPAFQFSAPMANPSMLNNLQLLGFKTYLGLLKRVKP